MDGLQRATEGRRGNVRIATSAQISAGTSTVDGDRLVVPVDLYGGTATSVTSVIGEVPSGTVNGVNVTFTLAYTPSTSAVGIYLNGARQKEDDDYTRSGGTLTFSTAPPTGSALLADYKRSGASSTTIVSGEVPTGSVDGANDTFTVANTPTSNSTAVYLGGSRMKESDDYTVSGATITFTTPPHSGSNILVDYEY